MVLDFSCVGWPGLVELEKAALFKVGKGGGMLLARQLHLLALGVCYFSQEGHEEEVISKSNSSKIFH